MSIPHPRFLRLCKPLVLLLAGALFALAPSSVSLAQSITFTGDSDTSVTLPHWDASYVYVSRYSGGPAVLTISGGATAFIEDLYVGMDGAGVLTVTGSGSKLTTGSTGFLLGSLSGDSGTIIVEDGGSIETRQDGLIGVSNGTMGSVLITGPGSTWQVQYMVRLGGYDHAGNSNGNGTLTIADGGAVSTSGVALAQNEGNGTLNIGAYDGTTTGGTLTGGITSYSTGGVINFNQTDTFTLSNELSGTGTLVQRGSGTTILTNAGGFSGTTTVDSGRLVVNTSLATTTTVGSTGTLAGTGSIGTLTVSNGGTLAPGNSPGTLTAGDTTFESGGIFQFEIANATGTAGSAYDLLSISGTLLLSAIAENPFILDVVSLDGLVAGNAANFNPTADYSFTFLTTTGGITDFSADKFSLLTSNFSNPFAGTWSVTLTNSGHDLSLSYAGASAIPEPSTYAALLGACALAFAASRRRKHAV